MRLFLIAGNTEIIIPVSCVEQGRWNYRSKAFASGERLMPPMMKREKQRTVALNLETGAGFRADQGMIWDEIAEKSERMKVKSSTGAMADLFEGQKDRLGEYIKAFHLVDFQVGAIFAINWKVVGLECFFHHNTFAKFFKKLIQSYALDAMDWLKEKEETSVPAAAIRKFTERVNEASRKVFPSLGLGENVRIEGPFATGAALTYKENILHLSIFSHDEKAEDNPMVPYQSFSRRRRRA